MGKRRTPIENAIPTTATARTTTTTANNVNDDLDVNNNNETAIPLQPAMSKSELVWKNAQTALSQNLIPIIAAKPQDLIASFHNRTNNDDHDDATTNSTNANSTTRRQLMETAQQLFRYIEHLASIEEKLKRVQKERRRRIKNNQMGEEEKHRHDHDDDHDDDNDGEPCILSGLPSLYIGQESTANQIEQRLDLELELDAETIWGQVDLQNNALMPKLKKLIKKLAKKADDENEDVTTNVDDFDGEEDLIRILDMDGMASDEGDDDNDEDDEDEDDQFDKLREDYEEVDEEKDEEESDADNDDEDDNDEARRIRQRMEKAMADMDDDSDDNNEDEEEEGAALSATKQKQLQKLKSQSQAMEHELNMNINNDDDGVIDPTREDMRDGFFDLHEMEAFADEEEEYLPEVAYGMVNEDVEDNEDSGDDSDEDEGGGKKKKKKKKKNDKKKKKMLPHVRQRMGQDSDSDDNDDGFDDDDDDGLNDDDDDSFSKALTKRYQPSTIRRKKYRADDEVEALYQLYGGDDGNNNNGGDNNNDGDFHFDEDDENSGEDTGGDAGVEMTAADFFGKPDESIIQRYKKNSSHEEEKSGGGGGGAMKKKKKMGGGKAVQLLGHDYNDEDDDDADSWDDHNFAEDGMDWKEGKARKRNDDEEEEDYDEDGNQEDGNSEEEGDGEEEEEMKGNNDADDNDGPKSKHALQSKKLQEQTLRIEQEMMAEKPWKMKGESKGTDRPSDSLLDSTPEFEVAFKPPPIITAEHTTNIEEMIKQRINDEDWDDVIPRELPDIGANKRGGGEAPEVSQEKSKLGLGELYEREYLKKTTGFDRDQHEKQTDEDAAKEEMKKLFANLCSQLDALSNYHFAPRPVAEEAEVENREDVPAIAMEEVLPLHVSGGRGVAPEEVYGAGKGRGSVLKGESEMDQVSSSTRYYCTILAWQCRWSFALYKLP